MKLHDLHPKRFFLETWRDVDRQAQAERDERTARGRGFDYRPLIVLCAGAVFLTLVEFLGGSRALVRLGDVMQERAMAEGTGGDSVWRALRVSQFAHLFEFAWWSAWRVLGYFILPVLVIKAMKERVRDHGLEIRGLREYAWMCVFAYAVVFVCVAIVSYSEEFSTHYPLYKLASRSWFDLVAWEMLYTAQFFSLEFFFRGFWLKACERSMGSHAIFATVVPYCMIHFDKPWIEALGAIIAGVVLGTLAMKTRSIWSGLLIHVSVAVSMDVAALLQTSGLPSRWYP